MASIRKRGNKYCVIYSYLTKEGVCKQKWETFKTYSEAKKRKKEVEYKQEVGDFIIPKCTKVRDLLKEYVEMYGRERWALSTYEQNTAKINNYILPAIGDVKLSDINVRFLERFYKELQTTKAIENPYKKPKEDEYVAPSVIRDIHKLLRSCFKQAVKWELMEKNPAEYATVPKYEEKPRDIWTAETLMYALSVCKDDNLKLAIQLSFSCSLRIGELLGLTWDCVDITEEAIRQNKACIYINKVLQRVSKADYKKHPRVWIITLYNAYEYTIFAFREISVKNDKDVYTVDQSDSKDRRSFLDGQIRKSQKDTRIMPTENGKMITLSTCTSRTEEGRFVVQAIKSQPE